MRRRQELVSHSSCPGSGAYSYAHAGTYAYTNSYFYTHTYAYA